MVWVTFGVLLGWIFLCWGYLLAAQQREWDAWQALRVPQKDRP